MTNFGPLPLMDKPSPMVRGSTSPANTISPPPSRLIRPLQHGLDHVS